LWSCKCLQYWDKCLPRPGRPDTDPLQRLWSPHHLTASFGAALIGNGAEQPLGIELLLWCECSQHLIRMLR